MPVKLNVLVMRLVLRSKKPAHEAPCDDAANKNKRAVVSAAATSSFRLVSINSEGRRLLHNSDSIKPLSRRRIPLGNELFGAVTSDDAHGLPVRGGN